MPRKKIAPPIDWKTQVYDIGEDATVTIRYDPARRPKMVHLDRVVIVGEHECAPMPQYEPIEYEPRSAGGKVVVMKRGGNFGFDENDPEYIARKNQLLAQAPAPPDAVPPVLTTEDVFRQAGIDLGGRPLDLGALAAAAAGREPIEE